MGNHKDFPTACIQNKGDRVLRFQTPDGMIDRAKELDICREEAGAWIISAA